MTTEQEQIAELTRQLKKARSRGKILDAKLKNQVTRYQKLEQRSLLSDGKGLQRAQAQAKREKRQKDNVLQQFAELEELFAASEETREALRQENLDWQEQCSEAVEAASTLRSEFESLEERFKLTVLTSEKSALRIQELTNKLEKVESERQLLAEQVEQKNRLCERRRLELDYLKAELFDQRQKLLASYMDQSNIAS